MQNRLWGEALSSYQFAALQAMRNNFAQGMRGNGGLCIVPRLFNYAGRSPFEATALNNVVIGFSSNNTRHSKETLCHLGLGCHARSRVQAARVSVPVGSTHLRNQPYPPPPPLDAARVPSNHAQLCFWYDNQACKHTKQNYLVLDALTDNESNFVVELRRF